MHIKDQCDSPLTCTGCSWCEMTPAVINGVLIWWAWRSVIRTMRGTRIYDSFQLEWIYANICQRCSSTCSSYTFAQWAITRVAMVFFECFFLCFFCKKNQKKHGVQKKRFFMVFFGFIFITQKIINYCNIWLC